MNSFEITTETTNKKAIYEKIANLLQNAGKLSHIEHLDATVAELSTIPENIHPEVKKALNLNGISQLYSHQVEAWEAYNNNQDIILQTPTSSGKSISFLLPAIHECLRGNSVLVFFNLKALAYDQSQKIKALIEKLPKDIRPQIININGDIPSRERKSLYNGQASIICVTPDVWNHELNSFQFDSNWGFRETIRKISMVIIDESHFYSGVFGCHFALLNRRLQLMIRDAGNNQQINYIFASATIGNAQEIAQKISNHDSNFSIINKSGAAKSETTFISLKPRNNTFYQTAQIAALLVSEGIIGICFCDSRELVKSLTSAIRKTLADFGLSHQEDTISAFYGTMKPNQRNKIIQDIQDGKIKFIVATSALEAGLDIGAIDATVVHGYPGSILSFRQRAGRAGRLKEGLLVFIPSKLSAMDNYYGNNPGKLLIDPPEIINFNHNYEPVLEQHILACCKESKPTLDNIQTHFGELGREVAKRLIGDNKILFSYNQRLATSRSLGSVHSNIKFRGNSDVNIALVNQDTGEEFESSNASSAITEVYTGAIYPAQDFDGNQVWYRCLNLEISERKAILKPIQPTNHFTRPDADTEFEEIKLNGDFKIIQLVEGAVRLTPVIAKITQEVSGYNQYSRQRIWTCLNDKCRNFKASLSSDLHTCPKCNKALFELETIENIKEEQYKEPLKIEYTTPSIRVEVNSEGKKYFSKLVSEYKKDLLAKSKYIQPEIKTVFNSGEVNLCIHTLAHQLMLSLPLVEHGANKKDIDFMLYTNTKPHLVGYFYDTCEHGTGMCDVLVNYLQRAINKARFLVSNCSCEYGCSNCTTIHRCPDNNEQLFKDIGLNILNILANE